MSVIQLLEPEANLGAGVKLSNLRNDGGEVHTRYSNQRIPTGLRKFGALIGEKCQLGCNAVLNPGVILGTACSVFPNLYSFWNPSSQRKN